ncbi:MAG: efflux RND transporter permease subunit [Archangium sp.]|nr:efflux RND transporter permease subunit [Archangium sp.]
MGKALRAVFGLFAFAIVGVIAMLALAKHNLETARFTQDVVVTVATRGFNLGSAEHDVTEQLEHALSQVEGVESIRSTTTSDVVIISVRAAGVGMDATPPVMLIQEAVRAAAPRLPSDLDVPVVQLVELDPPTRHFIASSDSLSRLDLSRWLDEVLRRRVEVQQGVRAVKLCGALRPELKVTLDPARLSALGIRADEVVNALQRSSLELPGGHLIAGGATLQVRTTSPTMEALQALELKPQVRLSDVATLEVSGVPDGCLSASDVLVSVPMFAATGELKLTDHPAVKLRPFTPVRTATYLGAPGSPVEETLRALSRAHPGAMITSEDGRFTVMFPEPSPLKDLPGIALRSLDEPHSVVRVSGPDFEQLTKLGAAVRDTLAKENPKWLGVVWPMLAPERVISAQPGVKDVAQTLRLAITGVETGRMEDGTRVRVRAGSSIEDAVLPDGRPLGSAVQISEVLAPAAMLRVNRQRVVELEVGLEPAAISQALKGLPLPPGYAVSVTQTEN